jgi:hypothetical protein
MERVNEYRQQVQAFLQDFAADDPSTQVVFDTERDCYLAIHNHWHNDARTYGCAIHLDIIDGQVWIQHNSTEIAIDQELRDRGVAKEDIILGFRSPSVRALLAQASA